MAVGTERRAGAVQWACIWCEFVPPVRLVQVAHGFGRCSSGRGTSSRALSKPLVIEARVPLVMERRAKRQAR